jgi:hypothetical protein
VVSFTHQPLYPQGKSPWYPLDRRLGGPQSRYGRGGEEKNSQCAEVKNVWSYTSTPPSTSPWLGVLLINGYVSTVWTHSPHFLLVVFLLLFFIVFFYWS